MSTEFEDTIRN